METPKGGPKDTEAPKLLEDQSSKNFQTNFTEREITLEFDEWIKLKNPSQEIVVSPPTDYPVEASVKGRGVKVKFSEKEILKDSTTYQINFGDAISDFTEGNIYKNLIFVFSTGDEIDSLGISGSVKDVISGKGEENIVVMLYNDLSDTCFTTNKPLYFTQTDKDGLFKLQNLRADTFQMFALVDGNVNYIYDQVTEKVGFVDSLLILNDTVNFKIDIELFDEIDPPRIVDYNQEHKGLIKAVYNPLPDKFVVTNEQSDTLIYNIEKDTLLIWHTDLSIDTNYYFISYDEQVDTIKNKKSRKSVLDKNLGLDNSQKTKISVYKGDSIPVEFNIPLSQLDSSYVAIGDSLTSFKVDSYKIENSTLNLNIEGFKADSSYTVYLEKNAVKDIYDRPLSDSIKLEVNIKDNSKLGTVNLSILNDSGQNCIIELMLGPAVIKSHVVDKTTELIYTRLESGTYKLKITEDSNKDGKWSPGSIKEKRQSERIKELSLEELKAGWDINMDVDINQIFDGTQGK